MEGRGGGEFWDLLATARTDNKPNCHANFQIKFFPLDRNEGNLQEDTSTKNKNRMMFPGIHLREQTHIIKKIYEWMPSIILKKNCILFSKRAGKGGLGKFPTPTRGKNGPPGQGREAARKSPSPAANTELEKVPRQMSPVGIIKGWPVTLRNGTLPHMVDDGSRRGKKTQGIF